ncbi:proline dehydrogenase family protein [Lacihabitans soyangensis]|uniref:Proline dehydrogenase n=1 Tax=Lacihabitans soyangensis TaxID=869394 RepID=A0AAE3H4H8_9BACT|nr:proline dehydrogenase family protein [Lacihabitans soyangensis]MCP9765034.1 proline dehydrogenase [Lacihabitans soyangensis]
MERLEIDFSDTKVAFENQSIEKLKKNYAIFALMNQNWLVKIGTFFIKYSLKFGLPIKKIIKQTIFELFCGGETIEDCKNTIENLHRFSVGTILDYSVEGEDDEKSFDATEAEVIASIAYGKSHKEEIPFSVFKITGIGSRDLLTKVQVGNKLSETEEKQWENFKKRFENICKKASECEIRLFVDAEETWIQTVIDALVLEKMEKYNLGGATYIYNTYQLYRNEGLGILMQHISKAKAGGFKIGAKLVRGAYMEKERKRAEELNYPDPINENKAKTDEQFNLALEACMDNIETVSLCCGTHNETSCKLGVDLLNKKGLDSGDQRVYFAQLLGMSDNISYNLAKKGYNVAKYVPYGPIEAVMPYLFRRADENTSIAGQSSREFLLLKKELKRRSNNKV